MTRTTFKKAIESYISFLKQSDELNNTFHLDITESSLSQTVFELFDLLFVDEPEWIKNLVFTYVHEYCFDFDTLSWADVPIPFPIYEGGTIVKSINSIDQLYDYIYEDSKAES